MAEAPRWGRLLSWSLWLALTSATPAVAPGVLLDKRLPPRWPASWNSNKVRPESRLNTLGARCNPAVSPVFTPGLVSGPSPQVSCCAWSDVHRFIYVKTAKTAGSSILLGALRSTLCPVTAATTAVATDFTRTLRFDADCPSAVLHPTGLLFPVTSDGGAAESPAGNAANGSIAAHRRMLDAQATPASASTDCVPCSAVEAWKWETYFVFGAARNPFERVVSSYDYCQVAALGLPFNFFCTQPDLAAACPAAAGPPKKNIHWAPQASAFFYRGSYNRVDFLLDVHSLAASLTSLTAHLQARAPAFPALNLSNIRVNVVHREETPFLDWYAGAAKHCLCTVEQKYKADVFHFGRLVRRGDAWIQQHQAHCMNASRASSSTSTSATARATLAAAPRRRGLT